MSGGLGGKQDSGACLEWLENAGRLGHEQSIELLAKTYTNGLYGITPDEEKATYWNNLRAAFEAGIDGTWSGKALLDGGQTVKTVYTFKAKGNTLTGYVVEQQDSPSIRIKNGKIDRNDLSFSYDMHLGIGKVTFLFNGLFLGDKLQLSYTHTAGEIEGIPKDIGKTPQTFIVKRYK